MPAATSHLDAAVARHVAAADSALGAKVAAALGVSLSDASVGLPADTSLDEVFAKGCAACGVSLPANDGAASSSASSSASANPWASKGPTAAEVESLPAFRTFLEKIEKSGYFGNTPKGTEDYDVRYAKALAKFTDKYAKKAAKKAAAEAATTKPSTTGPEAEAAALELKNQGNKFLNDKNYDEALSCYQKAVDACPAGPKTYIFHANAAAALIHLNRYEEAAEQCAFSIGLKEDYAKAHTRLGYAKMEMGDAAGAIPSLERALQISPGNDLAQRHLKTARGKAGVSASASAGARSGAVAGDTGAGAGGMPDLSALAGMMGGAGGGGPGGAGGMGGMMQAMMQNPAMMQQAQAAMQNPAMMQMAQNMMQNPSMMQNMMSMLGGGGGANGPDMSALAGMMGGMGGGAPGGAPGAPGAGGMPDLSGLMAAMGGAGGANAGAADEGEEVN